MKGSSKRGQLFGTTSNLGSNSSFGSFKAQRGGRDNSQQSQQDNISERSTFSRGGCSKLPRLAFNRSKDKKSIGSSSMTMAPLKQTSGSPLGSQGNLITRTEKEKGKIVQPDQLQPTDNSQEILSSLQSPLYGSFQKSSLKKRDLFDYQSAEKKKVGAFFPKNAQDISTFINLEDEPMTGSLPQPKQRNAVSFIDRPKLSKTKSLRPSKLHEPQSPTADLKGISKPANEQDEEVSNSAIQDEDFSRAISDDSYDGVPKTEDIRLPKIEEPNDELSGAVDKLHLNLENHSSEEICYPGQEEGLGFPMIKVVDDSQLLPEGHSQNKLLKPRDMFKRQGSEQLIYDSQHLQLPKSKAVSFINKNPMILESIEESPASRSRPHIKLEDGKDLNFGELVGQRCSPNGQMEVDDGGDGLPEVQEASDILVKQKSDDVPDTIEITPSEEPSSQFRIVAKQNSKSRSFADPPPARHSNKLFGNSFGKGSHGKGDRGNYTNTFNKKRGSFLSVNNSNPHEMNKLSARSKDSGRFRQLNMGGNADGLSQVSESYDQSFLSQLDQRNEVDLELIEQMKQSQSQALMDEYPKFERFSSVENDHTMKNNHGFTPVSFRHHQHMGISAGKTPVSYQSYLGECSAIAGSQGRSQLRQLFDGSANSQQQQNGGGGASGNILATGKYLQIQPFSTMSMSAWEGGSRQEGADGAGTGMAALSNSGEQSVAQQSAQLQKVTNEISSTVLLPFRDAQSTQVMAPATIQASSYGGMSQTASPRFSASMSTDMDDSCNVKLRLKKPNQDIMPQQNSNQPMTLLSPTFPNYQVSDQDEDSRKSTMANINMQMMMTEEKSPNMMFYNNQALSGQNAVMSASSAGASSLQHNTWLDCTSSSQQAHNQYVIGSGLHTNNNVQLQSQQFGAPEFMSPSSMAASCMNQIQSQVGVGGGNVPEFGGLPSGSAKTGPDLPKSIPQQQPMLSHYCSFGALEQVPGLQQVQQQQQQQQFFMPLSSQEEVKLGQVMEEDSNTKTSKDEMSDSRQGDGSSAGGSGTFQQAVIQQQQQQQHQKQLQSSTSQQQQMMHQQFRQPQNSNQQDQEPGQGGGAVKKINAFGQHVLLSEMSFSDQPPFRE